MATKTDSIQTNPSGKAKAKGNGLWGTVFFVLALVGILLYALRPVAMPPLFDDERTLESAIQESGLSGKPIFAIVSTSWCPACKSYKRNALVDKGIVSRLRSDTVPVYIDGDTDVDEARFIGITAYPTAAILIDGAVVAKLEGAQSVAGLNTWLDKYLLDSNPAQAPTQDD